VEKNSFFVIYWLQRVKVDSVVLIALNSTSVLQYFRANTRLSLRPPKVLVQVYRKRVPKGLKMMTFIK